MRILTVLLLLGLLTESAAVVFRSVDAQKTSSQLLFAFGDSLLDTGNVLHSEYDSNGTYNPAFRNWLYPYGITWPRKPAGRSSDGKILTDRFADLLNLSSPPVYMSSSEKDASSGVNFAVGGSGVWVSEDPAQSNLGKQIDNFEQFLHSHRYSKAALANSVTLVSTGGVDYMDFEGNTSAEWLACIEEVILGFQANMQRLYDNGLRNFIVLNQYQIDCLPIVASFNGYNHCFSNDTSHFMQVHNSFLLSVVQSFNVQNPGVRAIILDQYSAFSRLMQEAPVLGFKVKFKPCCHSDSGSHQCADMDPASQKPMFTLCKNISEFVFWDNYHATSRATNYIFNLYVNEPKYILLADAPTLKQWLQISNVIQESIAATTPQREGPGIWSAGVRGAEVQRCERSTTRFATSIAISPLFMSHLPRQLCHITPPSHCCHIKQ